MMKTEEAMKKKSPMKKTEERRRRRRQRRWTSDDEENFDDEDEVEEMKHMVRRSYKASYKAEDVDMAMTCLHLLKQFSLMKTHKQKQRLSLKRQ
jgi:hypothetical protein